MIKKKNYNLNKYFLNKEFYLLHNISFKEIGLLYTFKLIITLLNNNLLK